MEDSLQESPSRDTHSKFSVQILNASNNAYTSTVASPALASPPDRNDRSSIFEQYERKHASHKMDVDDYERDYEHQQHHSYPRYSPSRSHSHSARVSHHPSTNDKPSVGRVHEHRNSRPVSFTEDDDDIDASRFRARNEITNDGTNGSSVRRKRSGEDNSFSSDRASFANGVVAVTFNDTSSPPDEQRRRNSDIGDELRREREAVMLRERQLAAEAKSALERQKSSTSSNRDRRDSDSARRHISREERQAQIDQERHQNWALRSARVAEAAAKVEREVRNRSFKKESPSTSYDASHASHYNRDNSRRRNSYGRRRSYERDTDSDYDRGDHSFNEHKRDFRGHVKDTDHDYSRAIPAGYKGKYKGKNFDPDIAAKRVPSRNKRDDRLPPFARHVDHEDTRPPPYPLKRYELPAKPVSIYSPMPDTFPITSAIPSPPSLPIEMDFDHMEPESLPIPDPTRPPIKPPGTHNYMKLPSGAVRHDGEGLGTPTDPRENRILFIECLRHEKNRHRYANKLEPLKGYKYDKFSLQPAPTTCICIKGIPSALTETDLNTYFKGKYKTFHKMILHYDKSTGVSLGLVWIKFAKYHDAQKCIKELNGMKDFNLGKGYIGSVPPIQVRADDDRSVFNKVINDFYKKREDDANRARREHEVEEQKKRDSLKAATNANQPPKALPTPSTKIGFNPNQQTPVRPGVGVKTSWLSSASKPSILTHTPSHPKPLEMPKAGSEDTEDEDEWDDMHGDEIFRGRSDNMLTRKKDSPVKKSQHDTEGMDQDSKEPEISIDEKIKKNGNAHVFIDKSSLPIQNVDVVDVRAFFGQFKVTDVLKSDEGWFVLFAKPGIAGRAITTADGKQCSGFTMHLQLRDPEAQQLESHNDINKEKAKLSDKRPMSEEPEPFEDPVAPQEHIVKSKRGRVVKQKKNSVDFTSSESEGEGHVEKPAAIAETAQVKERAAATNLFKSDKEPITKEDVTVEETKDATVDGTNDDDVDAALQAALGDADSAIPNAADHQSNSESFVTAPDKEAVEMTHTESEQTASTDNIFDVIPDTRPKAKKAGRPKKAAAAKKKAQKPAKKSSKTVLKTQSTSKSEDEISVISETMEVPDGQFLTQTPIASKIAVAEAPPFEPISNPDLPYNEVDILSSDLVTSEEDMYYLKTVFDRQARKLPTDIRTLLQCHNYTPPDWKDDLRFSIFNSPEKTDENAPWRPPVNATGSARSEGTYPIPETEKAFYLPQRNKVTKASRNLEGENNVSSRANRSNARSLVHGLTGGATDGEILKFNQLRTRKKELRFAKSSIHSWGLYSCQVIPKGEMVIEYVGEVVRQQVADRREKAYEKQGIGSSYLFKIDDDNIVDATMKGSVARLINHCCQPNCTAKIITILGEKKIIIYAKMEIQPGDEITYDYHFPIEDEKIPCLCGVEGCRGSLN